MSDSDDGEWVFVRRASETEQLGGFAVEPSERNLKVLFAGPAKYWTDAIPIGNGRLGAMVWGGVQAETIQLNHDTLWTGVPGDYTNPQAPAVLSKVRQLVDDAKYAEATKEAFGLSGDPSDVYQPLGDIKVDFDDYHEPYSTYERELDLDTATAKIKYTIGDTEFTREHYASNPHQVIVTRISANKPSSLFFTVYLDSKLHHSSTANSATRIIMEGTCPGHRRRPKLAASENPNPKGIQFSAILDLKISPDAGTVSILEGRKLRVEGADWAVLLLAASSSFDGPFTMPVDSKKDPVSDSIAIMNSLTNLSFRQLYAYHLDDYQELFRRVTLQLSASSNNEQRESRQVESNEFCRKLGSRNSTEIRFHEEKMYHSSKDSETEKMINDTLVPTAERVKSFKSDEDPSFVELLFQYGRYLLISCSRPGTQVANLQGIWNKDVEPAWDAAPHLNINLQMNYWPSLPCNLSECQLPLFDYISLLAVNGSKTAKVNYETSGWVAHQVSDVWAKTSPDRGDPVWALWPMGGAWLCTHLWEHYSFSMDREFLKNTAYPLMKGCASFLLDWLIEGNGGLLETNPSTSPEHSFVAPDGQTASVSYSSTMDISIIKEIFSIVLFASEVLGRNDDDLVKKIRKAMPRLPPIRIARDGTIMEWAQDFQDPDIHHRHVSHLFGLFPGHTISIQKTPDLCKAAENSLYKRGDVGPGWSTTWKMALWARLHNSEHAYRLIKQLIILVDPEHESDFEGGLYSNLFTAHPPFQIDANFGFPAAITEMLVQSTEQDLYLLPALPRDKWRSGCVNGLKARGGVTVNICWKEGGLHETRLWSMNQNSVRRLHYNGIVSIVTVSYGKTYAFDKQLKFLRVQSHA